MPLGRSNGTEAIRCSHLAGRSRVPTSRVPTGSTGQDTTPSSPVLMAKRSGTYITRLRIREAIAVSADMRMRLSSDGMEMEHPTLVSQQDIRLCDQVPVESKKIRCASLHHVSRGLSSWSFFCSRQYCRSIDPVRRVLMTSNSILYNVTLDRESSSAVSLDRSC